MSGNYAAEKAFETASNPSDELTKAEMLEALEEEHAERLACMEAEYQREQAAIDERDRLVWASGDREKAGWNEWAC